MSMLADWTTDDCKKVLAGAALGAAAVLAAKRLLKWKPGKVWKHEQNGGAFASINAPTAGARSKKALPVGNHPIQLYSLGTPNGVKVTMMLEELGAQYDAWPINIFKGEQFGSEFVELNPNSKIPALRDHTEGGSPPVDVFESGSILLYLADKHGKFIPRDPKGRAECINWVMWQMGSGPYLGGGFGHFYNYAPTKQKYPINRFSMEVKRQLDVLDKHLATRQFMCGEEYTIADMAIWPWYGVLARGLLYGDSREYLQVDSYRNLVRWTQDIWERPATRRGRMVNRIWGDKKDQLHERHEPSDFRRAQEAHAK